MWQKLANILFKNSQSKKTWQGGVGIMIFILFIFSSVIVNRTVQALNQTAGNYGYYGGTYGYNASTTSSDAVPAAPTSLSSSVTTTTSSLSWTAPTLTTTGTAISTGSGSISSYQLHYSTSSLSSCSGGTSSTPTSASTSLSGLTASTTYYVAVCAVDNNSNASSALTGSFATSAVGGGGGTSGGISSGAITTPTPTALPTTPTVPTVPATTTVLSPTVAADGAQLAAQQGLTRDTAAEGQNQTKVQQSVTEFKVTLSATDVTIASNFITYGISTATKNLGSGERLALVRDQLETLGKVSLTALEQLANGQKPTERSLNKEQAQLGKVLQAFEKLLGRRPNFKIASEDLAWNTMMYRVRFKRDLNKERGGITKFRAVFKRTPTSPLDWASVRAWGYALSK